MTFLKDSLDYSAAISMQAKVLYLTRLIKNSLHYEIYLFTGHAFNAFLDNMVAVLIINAINHSVFKFLNKKLLLLE